MKNRMFWTRAALIALCFLTVLSFASCKADTEVGNNTELSKQFWDHVIADEHDAAYAMIKETATPEEFYDYWEEIQVIVEGATSYEIEQIGWNVNMRNGLKTYTSAYQVYLNNDKIVLFRIVTTDSIDGITGLHVSDATEFVNRTETTVPTLNIVLIVVSVLEIAFVIWMFVDCLRRKIKGKVLWAILIFFGFAVTVTVGERSGINFSIGLMLQTGSVVADPALLAVVTKIVLPVGAIVYFFLRKRLTVTQKSAADPISEIDYTPDTEDPSVSDAESEPNETAEPNETNNPDE